MILKKLIITSSLIASIVLSGQTSAKMNGNELVSSIATSETTQKLQFPSNILSKNDAEYYSQIFRLQEKGDWKKADKIIKKLDDRILMGHVMFQRYMHPNKYRSTYKELKNWMASYADHPNARRVYKLALRRKPKNWRSPIPPQRLKSGIESGQENLARESRKSKSPKRVTKKMALLQRLVKRALYRGHTLTAKKLLLKRSTINALGTYHYDKLAALLGKSYFFDGRDNWAIEWAGGAAKRSGSFLPEAHWITGLAYWRQNKKILAAKHFELSSTAKDSPTWLSSAASFWAARSFMVTGHPEKTTSLLKRAAKHNRTFYGLLATRLLGKPLPFRWDPPKASNDAAEILGLYAQGRRALGLLQIGRVQLAESELRLLGQLNNIKLTQHILSLAVANGMASLAIGLDLKLSPLGLGYDGAAYPVPIWRPANGFHVDRALIYALIRQESRFKPKAKSRAGARGLMQLMPRTARFVARAQGIPWHSSRSLYIPEKNLQLGQQYIETLLNDSKIKGSLFFMLAAWNGGPGNLNKWRKKTNYQNDSLLFIESIPSRETRDFIEKVISNLWVYRHRLAQPLPSLDEVVAGEWPLYTPLGQGFGEITTNE